jgi:hypothetical protein
MGSRINIGHFLPMLMRVPVLDGSDALRQHLVDLLLSFNDLVNDMVVVLVFYPAIVGVVIKSGNIPHTSCLQNVARYSLPLGERSDAMTVGESRL